MRSRKKRKVSKSSSPSGNSRRKIGVERGRKELRKKVLKEMSGHWYQRGGWDRNGKRFPPQFSTCQYVSGGILAFYNCLVEETKQHPRLIQRGGPGKFSLDISSNDKYFQRPDSLWKPHDSTLIKPGLISRMLKMEYFFFPDKEFENEKIRKYVRKTLAEIKVSRLRELFKYYSFVYPVQPPPKLKDELLPWFYDVLFKRIPDLEKREIEIENLRSLHESYEPFFTVCGYVIPEHLFAIVYSFMAHNRAMLDSFALVNSHFYIFSLKFWREITIQKELNKVFKIPTLILNRSERVVVLLAAMTKIKSKLGKTFSKYVAKSVVRAKEIVFVDIWAPQILSSLLFIKAFTMPGVKVCDFKGVESKFPYKKVTRIYVEKFIVDVFRAFPNVTDLRLHRIHEDSLTGEIVALFNKRLDSLTVQCFLDRNGDYNNYRTTIPESLSELRDLKRLSVVGRRRSIVQGYYTTNYAERRVKKMDRIEDSHLEKTLVKMKSLESLTFSANDSCKNLFLLNHIPKLQHLVINRLVSSTQGEDGNHATNLFEGFVFVNNVRNLEIDYTFVDDYLWSKYQISSVGVFAGVTQSKSVVKKREYRGGDVVDCILLDERPTDTRVLHRDVWIETLVTGLETGDVFLLHPLLQLDLKWLAKNNSIRSLKLHFIGPLTNVSENAKWRVVLKKKIEQELKKSNRDCGFKVALKLHI